MAVSVSHRVEGLWVGRDQRLVGPRLWVGTATLPCPGPLPARALGASFRKPSPGAMQGQTLRSAWVGGGRDAPARP